MGKLTELKQTRASKIEAQGKLVQTRKDSEEKVFTDEQRKQFDDLQTEIETLDRQIKEEQDIIDFEKRQAAAKGEPKGEPKQPKKGGEEKERAEIFARASVGKALRNKGKLDGAEKELNEIGQEENRNAAKDTPDNAIITLPVSALRNQSVTGNSGNKGGEYVIEQQPRPQLPFQPSTFLEDLGATRLSGLTGGSIPLPVASKYTMDWLAENAAITPQDKEHKGPELSPERLGGAVDISERLIIQSSVNVEQLIRSLIVRAYDTALNGAAINGSGNNNEPTGILNKANILLSDTTTATAPSWAQIVELMGLVDAEDADAISRAYLLSPQLRAALMTTKKDAGSGRFVMENKGELNGDTAASTSLVPKISTNDVLIYGDFSKLFIGEWGALSILEDPYSAALKNERRLVLNAHAGVEIAQPNSFAVNKFLDI